MATFLPLPKLAAGRPPFFGGPPLTTFAPDPDGPDDEYLVARMEKVVADLEHYAKQADVEPFLVVELIDRERKLLELLLENERRISPTILPPGVGSLYSLDEILEPETGEVKSYLKLIDRLDQLKAPIEREARFRKLFEAW